jgi:hypothetical protein
MLQKSTVIWLAIALTLGSVTWVITQQQNSVPESASIRILADPLIAFPVDEIQAITLEVNGETFDFEQRSEPAAQWWLIHPIEAPANRGAIAFLLTLLTEPQPYETFPVAQGDLATYGLASPYAVITVITQGGERFRLALGIENFDRTKIYGHLNNQANVLLLPLDFRNGVTRQPREWSVAEPEN